jgi:RNA polymerase sigma-54 factor
MALGQRMEIRQGQGLVMTPQLQQAIKLLQLSNLELQSFVEQELERNPLLEREEPQGPGEDIALPVRAEETAPAGLDRELKDGVAAETAFDSGFENVYADEARADTQARAEADSAESFGPPGEYAGASQGPGRSDGEAADLEAILTREVSLRDHLEAQIALAFADPGDKLIAAYLADLVDEAGYIDAQLGDAAVRLGISQDRVERVLRTMQGFEPSGVCARSLSECLAIQLREKDRCDPAMQAMLANLELLAKRDLVGLMRVCGVDAEDLAGMIAEIKALNPKPGLAFMTGEEARTVVPDVIVKAAPHGLWAVELNAETLPRVLVNQRYAARVGASPKAKEAKTFLADCLMSANWLVKSLDQRARTILKVSSEIVRQQDAFFAHGVQHLRPLVLKNVADAIGMHESTVSRVTSGKYMATPRGLFELKYFFTSAIQASGGGDAHSAEAVRHRIKELIDRERPQDILSDDKLVEILKGAGVDIARRTVAKYREALRIPSSVERRRLKALAS